MSEAALKHMGTANQFGVVQGGRPLDGGSMYGSVRMEAGLDFFTDLCKERDNKKVEK